MESSCSGDVLATRTFQSGKQLVDTNNITYIEPQYFFFGNTDASLKLRLLASSDDEMFGDVSVRIYCGN